MSKYGEMLAVMEFAKNINKTSDDKPKKKEKPINLFKELKKFEEAKKEYDEFIKSKEKKPDKKEKTILPTDWSLAKKTAFFAILGPPIGVGYVFGLVLMVRLLASFIVGVH